MFGGMQTTMKADVTEVAPCRQRISVEVPADKVDEAFDEAYSMLRDNVEIKGFRKGHAPRKMLERRFSKDVANDVRGKLFQDSFTEAMKEKDLAPMGDPDIDVETLEVSPGAVFTFETEVDVRPTFDLPEYKGIELTETVEPVKEAEIDEQIDNLRERFTNYEEVDGASQEGDALEVEALLKAGDEELINESGQRVKVEGDRVFGIEYKGLVKKLSGLKVGDEVEMKLTLPDDFHREELQGKKADANFKVEKVLRGERPEVDQAFAQRLGMDTVEKLRETIKANIQSEREQQARQQLEQDLVDKLLEKVSFDLPEEFMKRQTEAAFMRNQIQLARMGATKELLDERKDELRKSSDEETERTIRRTILFDAIADAENIEITEQEFQTHLTNLAQAYRTTPAEVLKMVQQRDGLPAMAAEIRDIKVTQMLLDNAKIKREGADNAVDAKPDNDTEKTEKE